MKPNIIHISCFNRRWTGITVLSLTVLALLLSGCAKDPYGGPQNDPDGKITISVEVPASVNEETPGGLSRAPLTRALTPLQERYLKNIRFLLFLDQNGTETLVKEIEIPETEIENSTNVKTFVVDHDEFEEGKQYRLVMFANVYGAGDPADYAVGETRPQVYEKVMLDMETRWNGGNDNWDTEYLPMWGESEDLLAYTGKNTVITTVQLLRAVAAFDLVLSEAAQAKFELTSVGFYNHPQYAKLVPDDGLYNHNTRKVGGVSIPAGWTADQTQIFTVSDPTQTANEIYMPESRAEGNEPDGDPFRLIIGGKFQGSTEPTYYYVPLTDDAGNPVDILRNTRYRITVQDVLDAGSPTPGGMFEEKMMVVAKILNWDESLHAQDIGNPNNRNHRMLIDKTFFHFNADGRGAKLANRSNAYLDYKINITLTDLDGNEIDPAEEDYPGWEISKITDLDGNELTDPWVTIGKGFHNFIPSEYSVDETTSDPEQTIISCEANTTEERRSAYIHVRSGGWEVTVQVTQDALENCGRNNTFSHYEYDEYESYRTHMYADPHTRTVRCWMVDNLKNAGPDDKYLNNPEYIRLEYPGKTVEGERGYYYSTNHILFLKDYDPCPPGWHTSTFFELESIIGAYVQERSYTERLSPLPAQTLDPYISDLSISCWFQPTNSAGILYHNMFTDIFEGRDWGQYSHYFAVSEWPYPDNRGAYGNTYGSNLIGIYYNISHYQFEISMEEDAFVPVRCVRDVAGLAKFDFPRE